MKKKKNLKKTLYVILILILIAITFCIYEIFFTIKDNINTENEIIEIKKEIIDSNEETFDTISNTSAETEEKLIFDFEKLKNINKDTVGWIKISNTNIDYPIVKYSDNNFYLTHSFYKTENRNGWIFENSENSEFFDDKNTVLFGHNTNSKTMFSELRDIYKGNLGNDISIIIYLENVSLNYKVFSIYLENPEQIKGISKYMSKDILNELKNKSIINFNIDVNENDYFLTLSTCNNVTEDRIIMHAKKI